VSINIRPTLAVTMTLTIIHRTDQFSKKIGMRFSVNWKSSLRSMMLVEPSCQTLYDQHYQMVEFALKLIVIFITEIIIAPVKIFTEAAASVASTVATALERGYLLSRRSRQQDRLSASMLSILFVCLIMFVCH